MSTERPLHVYVCVCVGGWVGVGVDAVGGYNVVHSHVAAMADP